MPITANYKAEVAKLLDDNSLIIDAWVDDWNEPAFLHIRHRKTFNLHHCKMSIPLASLRLIFHDGPRQAMKPRV